MKNLKRQKILFYLHFLKISIFGNNVLNQYLNQHFCVTFCLLIICQSRNLLDFIMSRLSRYPMFIEIVLTNAAKSSGTNVVSTNVVSTKIVSTKVECESKVKYC